MHCLRNSDQLASEAGKVMADITSLVQNQAYSGSAVVEFEKSCDSNQLEKPVTSEMGVSLTNEEDKHVPPEVAGVGIELLDSNLDCMLHVLSYLGVMDLVRVSEVCERWRDISRHKSLVLCHITLVDFLLSIGLTANCGNAHDLLSAWNGKFVGGVKVNTAAWLLALGSRMAFTGVPLVVLKRDSSFYIANVIQSQSKCSFTT
jgi:hypothetical protein